MLCLKPFPFSIFSRTYPVPCDYCVNCRENAKNHVVDLLTYDCYRLLLVYLFCLIWLPQLLGVLF